MTHVLNYTTAIKAGKTLGEVQEMLAEAGANAIMIQYDKGVAVALAFEMKSGDRLLRYRLPCRHEAIWQRLQREQPRFRTREHALNVAWRVLKDWVEVQLVLVEAKMACPSTVNGRVVCAAVQSRTLVLMGSVAPVTGPRTICAPRA